MVPTDTRELKANHKIVEWFPQLPEGQISAGVSLEVFEGARLESVRSGQEKATPIKLPLLLQMPA